MEQCVRMNADELFNCCMINGIRLVVSLSCSYEHHNKKKTKMSCHRKSVELSGSCPAFASMIFTSAEAFSARSPDGPAWTVHFGSGRPTHVLDSTACTASIL